MAGEGESERVSRATVELEIIDTNDNSPIFSQEVLQFRSARVRHDFIHFFRNIAFE